MTWVGGCGWVDLRHRTLVIRSGEGGGDGLLPHPTVLARLEPWCCM
jgi:hypothetical protein